MKTNRAILVFYFILLNSIFAFGNDGVPGAYELKGNLIGSSALNSECKITVVLTYNEKKGWYNEIIFSSQGIKSEVFSTGSGEIVGSHLSSSKVSTSLTIRRNTSNSRYTSFNTQITYGNQIIECQNMVL